MFWLLKGMCVAAWACGGLEDVDAPAEGERG